jgi:hypothetical protein
MRTAFIGRDLIDNHRILSWCAREYVIFKSNLYQSETHVKFRGRLHSFVWGPVQPVQPASHLFAKGNSKLKPVKRNVKNNVLLALCTINPFVFGRSQLDRYFPVKFVGCVPQLRNFACALWDTVFNWLQIFPVSFMYKFHGKVCSALTENCEFYGKKMLNRLLILVVVWARAV